MAPSQPGNIFYRDLNGGVNELELYNSPNTSINSVVYNAVHLSDTWKVADRVTLNLGARYERYVDGFPDQEFTPEGHSMLAGWTDARYQGFIGPVTVSAREVSSSQTLSPHLGVAYDLTGANRTVLKAYVGRFYFNSADTLSDLENPVGSARLRY